MAVLVRIQFLFWMGCRHWHQSKDATEKTTDTKYCEKKCSQERPFVVLSLWASMRSRHAQSAQARWRLRAIRMFTVYML